MRRAVRPIAAWRRCITLSGLSPAGRLRSKASFGDPIVQGWRGGRIGWPEPADRLARLRAAGLRSTKPLRHSPAPTASPGQDVSRLHGTRMLGPRDFGPRDLSARGPLAGRPQSVDSQRPVRPAVRSSNCDAAGIGRKSGAPSKRRNLDHGMVTAARLWRDRCGTARIHTPGKANAVPDTHLIAVIDDDEALREALCELLAALEYPCRSFPDGAVFLKAPDCSTYRCILADLRMPGLGGIELQAALAARGLRTPVIIMTSHISAHAKAHALAAGALAVLTKPLSEHDLLPLLEAALGGAPCADTSRSMEDE
jgi:two-component system response regulator FixJ